MRTNQTRIKEGEEMTADQVLSHRTFLRLFQSDLAKKLGCHENSIRNWEKGKKSISKKFRVKLENLVRIAK